MNEVEKRALQISLMLALVRFLKKSTLNIFRKIDAVFFI